MGEVDGPGPATGSVAPDGVVTDGVVTDDLADVAASPSIVTVGVFDGVHTGHRVLLDTVIRRGRAAGLRTVAVTFERHPEEVLRPGHEPPALQTLAEKVEALRATGVDHVHVLTFDLEASREPAGDFVRRVLVDAFGARQVLIGSNFRFGHGAAGDVALLQRLGERHGFEAEAIDLVDVDGAQVSSTAVRDALAAGDVGRAATALGRPHRVSGPVVRGDGRGRSIGVPTANVAVPDGIAVPAVGVYATRTVVDGDVHASVTNVGMRPTFGGDDVTVETHLLEGEFDLYGRVVAVEFVARLRDERRFDDVDALVDQIRADVETARDVLAADGRTTS